MANPFVLRRLPHRAAPVAAACALAVLCLIAMPTTASSQTSTASDPTGELCDTPSSDPFQPAPSVLRVAVSQQAQIDALAERFDVWSVDAQAGSLLLGGDAATLAQLQAEGFAAELDVAQTEQVAASLATLHAARAAACSADGGNAVGPASPDSGGAAPGIPGYACYRTVEQIDQSLRALAAAYPDLTTLVDIGDSWEKATPGGAAGSDLLALVITSKASTATKFPFVLMAAIHARELATGETALRFAEKLLAGYGTDAQATWLLDNGVLHLLPMVNPDGRLNAEAGMLWRKNTRYDANCSQVTSANSFGIDLNRNSTFAWHGCNNETCSSSYVCSPTYRGQTAGSEPETQAIERYLRTVFADQRGPGARDAAPNTAAGVFLSLHSYGQLVLRPWGYLPTASPNEAGLAAVGNRFAEIASYVSCQTGAPGCLYATDGTTDDWVYGTFGVSAHTVEMGLNFFESCSTFESSIMPPMEELLRYAFSIARRPYEMAQGPHVSALALQTPGTPAAVQEDVVVTAGQRLTITARLDAITTGAMATMGATVGAGAAGAGVAPGEILAPTSVVGGAMWTLDSPPWLATRQGKLMPIYGGYGDSAELVIATVPTSSWALGRHQIYVQGVDANGLVGAPSSLFVEVVAAPPGAPIIPDDPTMMAGEQVYLPFAGAPN